MVESREPIFSSNWPTTSCLITFTNNLNIYIRFKYDGNNKQRILSEMPYSSKGHNYIACKENNFCTFIVLPHIFFFYTILIFLSWSCQREVLLWRNLAVQPREWPLLQTVPETPELETGERNLYKRRWFSSIHHQRSRDVIRSAK